MNRPTIDGLRADIVPHHQWAISKWYYANPLWYYHRRRTDEEIVTDRKFYQLVDPELRQICHLLNEAGLHTTPSCQGHFYEKQRFEHVWETLTREQSLIRADGLIVKDSETDHEFLFRRPNYSFPWKHFDDFYKQAAAHQGIGYLGVLVPPDK